MCFQLIGYRLHESPSMAFSSRRVRQEQMCLRHSVLICALIVSRNSLPNAVSPKVGSLHAIARIPGHVPACIFLACAVPEKKKKRPGAGDGSLPGLCPQPRGEPTRCWMPSGRHHRVRVLASYGPFFVRDPVPWKGKWSSPLPAPAGAQVSLLVVLLGKERAIPGLLGGSVICQGHLYPLKGHLWVGG